MNITSDRSSPVRPIGSDVVLTCTVLLSPIVDVSVAVDIQLKDITGYSMTTSAPYVSVSGHTYISTATVASFGRPQSGIYICTATVSSMFPLQSASTRVSTGKNNPVLT